MKKFLMLSLPFILAAALAAEPELVIQKDNTIEDLRILKYSDDSKYIMSATLHEANVYERESGILIKTFAGGFIKDFSPNAKYLLVTKKENGSNNIILTEIDSGKRTVIGQDNKDDYIKGYSFSQNSKLIALADSDCVTIFDVKTKKQWQILKGAGYFIYDKCAWNTDSRFIAIPASKTEGKKPSIVIVYDLKNNKTVKTIESNFGFERVTLSTNANLVAFAIGGAIVQMQSVFSDEIQKRFEIEMPSFEEGRMIGLSFSPDEKKIVAAREYAVAEYEISSGALNLKKQNANNYALAFSPAAKNELAIASKQGIKIYESGSDKEIKTIQGISGLLFASDKLKDNCIFVCDRNGKSATIFDKKLSRLAISENAPETTSLSNLSLSKNTLYYSDPKTKAIYSRDINTKKDATILKNVNATNLLASPDGSFIAFYDSVKKQTYICNTSTKKMTIAPGFDQGFYNVSSAFSPLSNYVFLDGMNGKQVVYGIKENFDVLRTALTLNDINFLPAFSSDEKYFFAQPKKGGVKVYDTSAYKWREIKEFKHSYYPFCSPDGKFVGMYEYDEKDSQYHYFLYSVGSWSLVTKFSRGATTSLYNFFSLDNSMIYAFGTDGTIQAFSVKDKRLVACALADKNGDWLAYTSEGYFDGSEKALKTFVYLVDGMTPYPLDSLAEKLYRPDLLAAKFDGANVQSAELPQNDSKPSAKTDLAQIVSSGQPPLVDFIDAPKSSSSRDVTINFTVKDQGGGIGGVYLKLNGKTVTISGGERKLELVGDAPQGKSSATITFSHPVSLQNGENKIEIFASNSTGMIEGEHKTASITWQGKTQKPSLYVLAVGVNKYRDKSLWLNYAVPDASAVSDTFKNIKGKLYQSINISTVFDGDVTEAGVASAFDAVASKISADDVFVFYISGHGTTHTDGDYYFIPVDFRFRNAQSVAESALSKKFIADQLSKIKAQKSLVLLDTCNSGAFISTGARGMAEKTAIDRLSRATGQATIAASSDSQSAMEGYKGHGIFTYVILEALSGKADLNKDGYVTVSELAMYAEDKVPTYSYDKWGYEQYPQVDLRKQSNFPLVGK